MWWVLVHGFGEKQGWMERLPSIAQYYKKVQAVQAGELGVSESELLF